MNYLFLEYPKCTTCKKAKKWLKENNIDFSERNIIEDNPTKEELKKWHYESKMSINKFFNTSGKLYREMNLKDKIKDCSTEELINILSTNGMLIKRPLLISNNLVLVGFKEEEWNEKLK
ncbi:Spx/MgsR family RNA polymerase-binding regulatory protein [Clostridium tarantellae]|uniref:Spx/MgsR family RNA polymerase-binding regulatory protein n=1 Tax=Clostridium tarantellae TaxID=39493 RepID=A0A6I1MU45_9CLOT|nr:Spx/MgsR family RNA polymerase-binding regulatory protein [Clostridium tarantellae]MPQ43759.1 Spx/MgsR family RNA polymerase-binding regulatory protein [Clostridium tarantellae]